MPKDKEPVTDPVEPQSEPQPEPKPARPGMTGRSTTTPTTCTYTRSLMGLWWR